MSIETLTGDEFVELTPAEHEEALALYADAVNCESKQLQALEPGTQPHEYCLDKMARLLSLRKVHQVRLAELQEDEQPLPRLAALQYARNEQADLAA